jgi:hypothetical protein
MGKARLQALKKLSVECNFMSERDYFNIMWFTDYLGIGYACDKKGCWYFLFLAVPQTLKCSGLIKTNL